VPAGARRRARRASGHPCARRRHRRRRRPGGDRRRVPRSRHARARIRGGNPSARESRPQRWARLLRRTRRQRRDRPDPHQRQRFPRDPDRARRASHSHLKSESAMRRHRNAKIVATLGPSSSDAATIRALFDAGADVFRLNFSHGTQDQHRERLDIIRTIERETARPIAVLLDLQGPKLRVGTFAGSPVRLEANAAFRLDMDAAPGDATRASLPHPEIFAALTPGIELLLDDGKIRLVVERCGPAFAETRVTAGGLLSDRKGVNVPGVVLPIAILTPKDKSDLEFGLSLGVDWVALSFVQRAQDLDEARALIGGRAAIMSKLEKPAAIEHLDAI